MNCIICRMAWRAGQAQGVDVDVRSASYTVGGAGLCALHVDNVVDALLAGYSMKEILGEALSGDWE